MTLAVKVNGVNGERILLQLL